MHEPEDWEPTTTILACENPQNTPQNLLKNSVIISRRRANETEDAAPEVISTRRRRRRRRRERERLNTLESYELNWPSSLNPNHVRCEPGVKGRRPLCGWVPLDMSNTLNPSIWTFRI